jgi:hypothetical protein
MKLTIQFCHGIKPEKKIFVSNIYMSARDAWKMEDWDRALKEEPNSIKLRFGYLLRIKKLYVEMGVESAAVVVVVNNLSDVYGRSLMEVVAIARKMPTISSEDMAYLIQVFVLYCHSLSKIGMEEMALAAFQAEIEFVFGRLLGKDNETWSMESFKRFWDSELPRFGEMPQFGWAASLDPVARKSCFIDPILLAEEQAPATTTNPLPWSGTSENDASTNPLPWSGTSENDASTPITTTTTTTPAAEASSDGHLYQSILARIQKSTKDDEVESIVHLSSAWRDAEMRAIRNQAIPLRMYQSRSEALKHPLRVGTSLEVEEFLFDIEDASSRLLLIGYYFAFLGVEYPLLKLIDQHPKYVPLEPLYTRSFQSFFGEISLRPAIAFLLDPRLVAESRVFDQWRSTDPKRNTLTRNSARALAFSGSTEHHALYTSLCFAVDIDLKDEVELQYLGRRFIGKNSDVSVHQPLKYGVTYGMSEVAIGNKTKAHAVFKSCLEVLAGTKENILHILPCVVGIVFERENWRSFDPNASSHSHKTSEKPKKPSPTLYAYQILHACVEADHIVFPRTPAETHDVVAYRKSLSIICERALKALTTDAYPHGAIPPFGYAILLTAILDMMTKPNDEYEIVLSKAMQVSSELESPVLLKEYFTLASAFFQRVHGYGLSKVSRLVATRCHTVPFDTLLSLAASSPKPVVDIIRTMSFILFSGDCAAQIIELLHSSIMNLMHETTYIPLYVAILLTVRGKFRDLLDTANVIPFMKQVLLIHGDSKMLILAYLEYLENAITLPTRIAAVPYASSSSLTSSSWEPTVKRQKVDNVQSQCLEEILRILQTYAVAPENGQPRAIPMLIRAELNNI